MLKIGLTGGIGSGKSTVSRIFKNLGIPVFDSDLVAKKILDTNGKAIGMIKKEFGDVFQAGKIDRKALAKLVFDDTQKLDRLNAIVHPLVAVEFEKFCTEHSNAAYIIKEAAIIFESGLHYNLDRIITLYVPKEERIRRVIDRDGVGVEDVEKRMSNQWSDEEKNKMADFIIINDNKEQLVAQVMELNELFLTL